MKRPKKEEERERKRTIVGSGGLRTQIHWFRAASIRFNVQEKYIEQLINGCIGVHVLKNMIKRPSCNKVSKHFNAERNV